MIETTNANEAPKHLKRLRSFSGNPGRLKGNGDNILAVLLKFIAYIKTRVITPATRGPISRYFLLNSLAIARLNGKIYGPAPYIAIVRLLTLLQPNSYIATARLYSLYRYGPALYIKLGDKSLLLFGIGPAEPLCRFDKAQTEEKSPLGPRASSTCLAQALFVPRAPYLFYTSCTSCLGRLESTNRRARLSSHPRACE